MNRFDYARPASVAEAVQAGTGEQVRYLAGGTNLIVCYRNSQITTVPIDEALTMTKDLDEYMYRVAQEITI